MTTLGHGWSSNSDRDLSASSLTTREFEFNQRGKSAKAVIGLAILVVLGLGLAFFQPIEHHNASTSSAMVSSSAQR